MSEQFVGEIRFFPYNRGAPSGWLMCDGSTQNIRDYQILFQLLGTTYGGDGQNNFGLPDLRGRVPIATSPNYPLGDKQGSEKVALTVTQLPQHNHFIEASTSAATATDPSGMVFAAGAAGADFYAAPTTAGTRAMAGAMVGMTGQGLQHENCAPTLPIHACIAWQGIYPPRND